MDGINILRLSEEQIFEEKLNKLYLCEEGKHRFINILEAEDNKKYYIKYIKDVVVKTNGIYTFVFNSREKSISDIKFKLDYTLTFANERNSLVSYLVLKNDWLIDYISTDQFRKRQVKNKKDFLAESLDFEKTIDEIVDYISMPNFNDSNIKTLYEETKDKYNNYKNIDLSNFSSIDREKIKDKIFELKEEMVKMKNSCYEYKFDKINRENTEKLYSFIDNIISKNEGAQSVTYNYENKNKNTTKTKRKILKNEYWDKMFSSDKKNDIFMYNKEIESGKEFRKDLYNSYVKDMLELKTLLGFGLPQDEKEKIREGLLNKIKPYKYKYKDKEIIISPEKQLVKLDSMYKSMVGNLQDVTKILTNEIPTSNDSRPAEFNYNHDTFYIDEQGEEIHVSYNFINFANKDTYKGILKNYLELKVASYDKLNSDMKWILEDFDNLIYRTKFTEQELLIINCLKNDKTNREIIELYTEYFNDELRPDQLTRIIDTYIPNKILRTYLKNIDDWVYTYKIKGQYKTCNKCGEVKIISNNRYFDRDLSKQDGFKTVCKECRTKTAKTT